MFDKNRSIKVSERVFDLVKDELKMLQENENIFVEGRLETFNNCREQGYVLIIDEAYRDQRKNRVPELYVWVAENRNSDDIVVYIDDKKQDLNNNITDKAYDTAEYFEAHHYAEASDYIVEVINKAYDLNAYDISYKKGEK